MCTILYTSYSQHVAHNNYFLFTNLKTKIKIFVYAMSGPMKLTQCLSGLTQKAPSPSVQFQGDGTETQLNQMRDTGG